MSSFFDKLNLRPSERRLVVLVGIAVFVVLDVVIWPVAFVFVPTLLMGGSFPLISSLALVRADREGATTGCVYFFNLVGNVLGGVVTGFLLLPLMGTERTVLVFSTTGLALGWFALAYRRRRRVAEKRSSRGPK